MLIVSQGIERRTPLIERASPHVEQAAPIGCWFRGSSQRGVECL